MGSTTVSESEVSVGSVEPSRSPASVPWSSRRLIIIITTFLQSTALWLPVRVARALLSVGWKGRKIERLGPVQYEEGRPTATEVLSRARYISRLAIARLLTALWLAIRVTPALLSLRYKEGERLRCFSKATLFVRQQ